jgi:hypothetical protein
MKTSNFIGVVLLIGLVFVGCDTGTGGNSDDGLIISSLRVKTTGIRSLYVSNIPVNNGSRAVGESTIQTLSYINNVGENTPFFFVSPSGKTIVLSVRSLRQLDDKRILVKSDSYSVIKTDGNTFTITETGSLRYSPNMNSGYLIDFEKNKIYDFVDWDIYFLHNDVIYAGGNDATLYKIDINNISIAMPLNNRKYFQISSVKPIVFNNKILGGDNNYVIDINNNFPITPKKDAYITNEMCSFIPTNSPIPSNNSYKVDFFSNQTGLTFQDLTGNVWFFITGGKTPGLNTNGYHPDYGSPDKYFLGKINIADDGQVFLTDCVEDTFSNTLSYNTNRLIFKMNSTGNGSDSTVNGIIKNTIIIICDDGFITMTRKVNGIQIETTALTLSLPVQVSYGGRSFIQDNYLYYLDNTAIKRIHLSAGSSVENVYSNSRILTSGSVENAFIYPTGNNIIFYQFAEDNVSVNTYLIPMYEDNPTPKLLATSSVNMRDIVELDF